VTMTILVHCKELLSTAIAGL